MEFFSFFIGTNNQSLSIGMFLRGQKKNRESVEAERFRMTLHLFGDEKCYETYPSRAHIKGDKQLGLA